MKNSFSLLLALSIAFIGMICYACINDHPTSRLIMSVDSLALYPDAIRQTAIISGTEKVIEINKLAQSVKQINEIQNGVCDTCVTGFQSAIIENRLVAEQLSKETHELEKKLESILRLKSDADKALSTFNKQTDQLVNILSVRGTIIKHSQKEIEETKRLSVLTSRY